MAIRMASALMTGSAPGSVETGEFMGAYAALLCKKVRDAAGGGTPLAGVRIVVEAGNGAVQ